MRAWPTAVTVLAEMKGSSDGYLIQASDHRFYVVKHSAGPFKERLLVNELFAATLARRIGLPVPVTRPILVPESLAQGTSASCLRFPWASGLHCGSEFVVKPTKAVYDYFPERLLLKVTNLDAAMGAWVFDIWTGNADQTQAVFYRRRADEYLFAKIDHGWCFGAGNWVPQDLRRPVLRWQKPVMGEADFESQRFGPHFERIHSLTHKEIAACAASVPSEWFQTAQDQEEFDRLVSCLARRAAHLDEHAGACWPSSEDNRMASTATR